ncbi:MAG: acyl-CoA thioesterase [Gemmatimonadota bacterium]
MQDESDVIEIRVRYAETDQMGRAHHSHYLVWCELGRTRFMRGRGISYAELERRGLRLPVSKAHVEYRQGVGYDDTVRIRTRVEQVRSRSVRFAYRLERGDDGVPMARAWTELVCTNAHGTLMRLPTIVRSALER